MNKTAEEILKEYYNHYKNVVFPEKNWVEWQDSHDYGSVEMIVAAMESYASSLSSEVERLRGELAEAQQADDWVRVGDGLPERRPGWSNSEDVNIYYPDGVVSFGSYSYELNKWQDYIYTGRSNPTRWHPLPSPPKQ